jgi:predicted nucleotidyltransferase
MNHTPHEKLLSAHPVDDAVRAQIMDSLRALEHQHDVKVLFACESGSRGWGFASPDSDYDVRFIYVNRPAWYLSVDPRRDVIELPISGDLDINGWDLRKALQLLKRSNPTLLEWLRSPIVYMEDVATMARFQNLAETSFSSLRGYHHYVSMAKKNFREYLKGEVVRYKKYLYVLRPLLAARWIREGRGVPPMRFAELAQATVRNDAVLDELNRLLEVKMRAGEGATSPRWPAIHAFIESELQLAQAHTEEHDPRPDTSGLDAFLFDVVTHVEEKKNERD